MTGVVDYFIDITDTSDYTLFFFVFLLCVDVRGVVSESVVSVFFLSTLANPKQTK